MALFNYKSVHYLKYYQIILATKTRLTQTLRKIIIFKWLFNLARMYCDDNETSCLLHDTNRTYFETISPNIVRH